MIWDLIDDTLPIKPHRAELTLHFILFFDTKEQGRDV
jgi:hypothetical protein